VASGDKDMPLRLWRASTKKRFDRQIGLALAGAAEQMDNLEDAATILESIVEANPASTAAGSELAELYLRRNKPAKALNLLGRIYSSAPDRADALNAVLRRVADKLDQDSALETATAALESKTASAGRRYAAARLAGMKGADELARKLYQAALEKNPNFSPAYAALASSALTGGDADELRKLDARLKKMAETSPSAMLLTVRARVQLARHQPASALDTLAKARELDEGYVPAAILQANILERRDQATRARRALLETLMKAPRDARLYHALFESYFESRRFAEAEAIASRATQRLIPPAEGKLMQVRLALAQRNIDEFESLMKDLKVGLPGDVRVRTLELQAEVARHPGMLSKAEFEDIEKRLASLVQDNPGYEPVRRLLAQVYGEVAQYEPASKHWEHLFRQTFAERETAMPYAAALAHLQRFDRAAGVLQAARAYDPDDLLLRRMLLDVWERGEQYATAAEHAEKWYNQEKDAQDASALRRWYFWRLMEMLRRAEKYDKALRMIDDRLEKEANADEETLRSQRLRVRAAAAEYDKLTAEATAWVSELAKEAVNADDSELVAQLLERRRFVQRLTAALLMDGKQYDQTQKLLDQWIGGKTGPEVEHLRSLKILCWGEAPGKLKAARKYALEWIEDSPAALAPRQSLVAAMEDNKEYAAAAELLGKWVKDIKVPTDLATPSRGEAQTLQWCRMAHVMALTAAGEHKKALARANEYLKESPRDPALLRYKAVALSELGQQEQQLSVLEQIYSMDRQDPGINNDLGYSYADAGEKLEKAERMIRSALQVRPGTTAFIDSLGWVLYKQGEFAAAGAQFRRILEDQAFVDANDPTEAHPVIFDHAGDVMYRLGWTERARRLWSHAARLGMEIKDRSSEVRQVIIRAEAKLVALKKGRQPEVAGLGEGVKRPSQNEESAVE
jgi:tetratricopeptide (TPR) repeat protein